MRQLLMFPLIIGCIALTINAFWSSYSEPYPQSSDFRVLLLATVCGFGATWAGWKESGK